MTQLSRSQIERYQRHLSLPGFGAEAQEALRKSSVLMIGAGGLGCPALQYLAAAGVGTLGIVDDDTVARSNLQRQVLFCEEDIGQPKVERAAARLKTLNPEVTIHTHQGRINEANAAELCQAYDIIVDGSDNFPTRYLVNDACVLFDKPLVYGAIEGFTGQASVFNYAGGPTYRCLFPSPPNPEDAPSCAELGVLGVLPGLIGVVQATEAIKLITGIGQTLSGTLLLWDALTMQTQRLGLSRDPNFSKPDELRLISYQCQTQQAVLHPDEIPPLALEKRLRHEAAPLQLIDVREPWERAICQLPSRHIPLTELQSPAFRAETYGLEATSPTVIYCKAGARSLRALETLRMKHGFSDLKSLQGGILRWGEEIDPNCVPY